MSSPFLLNRWVISIVVAQLVSKGCSCKLLAAASTQPSSQVRKWRPESRLDLKAGNIRNLGQIGLMAPVAQNDSSLFFMDARFMRDSKANKEGNFGVGARLLDASRGWIWGGYGYFDHRRSEYHNTFYQLTMGVEALSEDWDMRLNTYVPLSKSRFIKADKVKSTPIYRGHNEYIKARKEVPLKGFDVEIGRSIAGFEQLRLFGGGYHFWGKGVSSITGGRIRAEFQINEYVSLNGELQYDPRRQSRFIGVSFRAPFGDVPAKPLTKLEQRMMQKPVRDIDIVARPTRPQEIATGRSFVFSTPGALPGGNGTCEHPYNSEVPHELLAGLEAHPTFEHYNLGQGKVESGSAKAHELRLRLSARSSPVQIFVQEGTPGISMRPQRQAVRLERRAIVRRQEEEQALAQAERRAEVSLTVPQAAAPSSPSPAPVEEWGGDIETLFSDTGPIAPAVGSPQVSVMRHGPQGQVTPIQQENHAPVSTVLQAPLAPLTEGRIDMGAPSVLSSTENTPLLDHAASLAETGARQAPSAAPLESLPEWGEGLETLFTDVRPAVPRADSPQVSVMRHGPQSQVAPIQQESHAPPQTVPQATIRAIPGNIISLSPSVPSHGTEAGPSRYTASLPQPAQGDERGALEPQTFVEITNLNNSLAGNLTVDTLANNRLVPANSPLSQRRADIASLRLTGRETFIVGSGGAEQAMVVHGNILDRQRFMASSSINKNALHITLSELSQVPLQELAQLLPSQTGTYRIHLNMKPKVAQAWGQQLLINRQAVSAPKIAGSAQPLALRAAPGSVSLPSIQSLSGASSLEQPVGSVDTPPNKLPLLAQQKLLQAEKENISNGKLQPTSPHSSKAVIGQPLGDITDRFSFNAKAGKALSAAHTSIKRTTVLDKLFSKAGQVQTFSTPALNASSRPVAKEERLAEIQPSSIRAIVPDQIAEISLQGRIPSSPFSALVNQERKEDRAEVPVEDTVVSATERAIVPNEKHLGVAKPLDLEQNHEEQNSLSEPQITNSEGFPLNHTASWAMSEVLRRAPNGFLIEKSKGNLVLYDSDISYEAVIKSGERFTGPSNLHINLLQIIRKDGGERPDKIYTEKEMEEALLEAFKKASLHTEGRYKFDLGSVSESTRADIKRLLDVHFPGVEIVNSSATFAVAPNSPDRSGSYGEELESPPWSPESTESSSPYSSHSRRVGSAASAGLLTPRKLQTSEDELDSPPWSPDEPLHKPSDDELNTGPEHSSVGVSVSTRVSPLVRVKQTAKIKSSLAKRLFSMEGSSS